MLRVNRILCNILATALEFATISSSNVKVWVNFIGTGTVSIRDDLNVSSITDNGTGDYSVNFTSALADANYSVVGCFREDTSGGTGQTTNRCFGIRRDTSCVTTSLVRVGCATFAADATDAETVYVGIFR